jgi:hypothetical protein
MGFISKSYSVRKLTYSLRRKKGLTVCAGRNSGANSGVQGRPAADTLDRYIYDNLFIPIVRDGRIPIRGLDIARLTNGEFDKLADALTHCSTDEYNKLGLVFASLRPAADTNRGFI